MNLKFDTSGLIPGIVQHAQTGEVLMLGYLSQESFDKTLETGLVTFYSRSRKEIWVKGDTSGNYLRMESFSADCDSDALLIKALPDGPTCHTGAFSCFEKSETSNAAILGHLTTIIAQRFTEPKEGSYIQSLREKGIAKIAQKVGEEAVETVIEAMRDEPQLFLEESADLFFHYLVLLQAKGVSLDDVLGILKGRVK